MEMGSRIWDWSGDRGMLFGECRPEVGSTGRRGFNECRLLVDLQGVYIFLSKERKYAEYSKS